MTLPTPLVQLFQLNEAIPNYRAFTEARDDARGKALSQLSTLDLQAVLSALQQLNQTQGR